MSDTTEGMGVAAMAAMMLFFGGLGIAAGVILWAAGLPWHRVLTCGAAGAALGVAVTVVGLWLGGGDRGGERTG